jgi:hypothetical protein
MSGGRAPTARSRFADPHDRWLGCRPSRSGFACPSSIASRLGFALIRRWRTRVRPAAPMWPSPLGRIARLSPRPVELYAHQGRVLAIEMAMSALRVGLDLRARGSPPGKRCIGRAGSGSRLARALPAPRLGRRQAGRPRQSGAQPNDHRMAIRRQQLAKTEPPKSAAPPRGTARRQRSIAARQMLAGEPDPLPWVAYRQAQRAAGARLARQCEVEAGDSAGAGDWPASSRWSRMSLGSLARSPQ